MDSKTPRVYVVTAVHNDKDTTVRFLKSVLSSNFNFNNVRVVVVDDGSTDGTGECIENIFTNVVVLRGNGSLWWTGSMKLAISYVLKKAKTTDFVLTINNDCLISKDYIKNIVDSGKHNKRSIIGSVIMDINTGLIFDAGVKIDWKKSLICSNIKRDYDRRYDFDNDTLSTKGTLYSVTVFKEIGNFNDKRLPHYLSDYEIACRAKRMGWNLVVDYMAVVKNDKSRTGRDKSDEDKISYENLKNILFDRKSKNNIIDKFNFINLCCPRKYLVVNYFWLLLSFLYYLSFVNPFYYFRPFIKRLKAKIYTYEK